jgi:ABC-type dipeptide/oligopeptide/nickel transport system ATPase component
MAVARPKRMTTVIQDPILLLNPLPDDEAETAEAVVQLAEAGAKTEAEPTDDAAATPVTVVPRRVAAQR